MDKLFELVGRFLTFTASALAAVFVSVMAIALFAIAIAFWCIPLWLAYCLGFALLKYTGAI